MSATPTPGGMSPRTDADYAIEHAGYLAEAAKRYLSTVNAEHMAAADYEENPCDETEAAIDAATEDCGEAYRGLTNAIYEFEKRRDRAIAQKQNSGDGNE